MDIYQYIEDNYDSLVEYLEMNDPEFSAYNKLMDDAGTSCDCIEQHLYDKIYEYVLDNFQSQQEEISDDDLPY